MESILLIQKMTPLFFKNWLIPPCADSFLTQKQHSQHIFSIINRSFYGCSKRTHCNYRNNINLYINLKCKISLLQLFKTAVTRNNSL